MSIKWKIFEQKLEWYDIKTKFKQLLRKIAYSRLFQEIICLLLVSYMKLVFLTSKKKFIFSEALQEIIKNRKPFILCFWHNRLMMMPFLGAYIIKKSRKYFPEFHFMSLASKHGDGRFVGRAMEKFGLMSILGSTQGGRKSSRGIDIGSLRQIFSGLKKGYGLGITPDGPRGPNQKINGEFANIARISGATLFAISCSSSRFKTLKTWDSFKIPLPFSALCFYVDEEQINIAKNSDEDEMKTIESQLETRMNLAQEKSLELALQYDKQTIQP